jgi:hypothetical protein
MRATGIGSCSYGQNRSTSRGLAQIEVRAYEESFTNGLEHNMNHIELNAVEADITESQALVIKQTEEAITELNSAQLILVGGGSGIVSWE